MTGRPWTREHHGRTWHYDPTGAGTMACGLVIPGSPLVSIDPQREAPNSFLCPDCRGTAYPANPTTLEIPMSTTPAPITLASALANAQAELTDPLRTKVMAVPNRPSRMYAGLDDLFAAVRPVLARHGIAITQTTERAGEEWVLATRLRGFGETIESLWPFDFKGGPQDIGSRLTYFRRYSLEALVGVAATHDDDAEAPQASHRDPKPAKGKATPDASPPATRARSAEVRVQETPTGVRVTDVDGQRDFKPGKDGISWEEASSSPRSRGPAHREPSSSPPPKAPDEVTVASSGGAQGARWTDDERRAFFRDLTAAWPAAWSEEDPQPRLPSYDDLAAWLEAHGHPRPSGMTAQKRARLLGTIRHDPMASPQAQAQALAKRAEIAAWIERQHSGQEDPADRLEREAIAGEVARG